MLIGRPANECQFLGVSLAEPYLTKKSLKVLNKWERFIYRLTSIIKFRTDRKLKKEIQSRLPMLFPKDIQIIGGIIKLGTASSWNVWIGIYGVGG